MTNAGGDVAAVGVGPADSPTVSIVPAQSQPPKALSLAPIATSTSVADPLAPCSSLGSDAVAPQVMRSVRVNTSTKELASPSGRGFRPPPLQLPASDGAFRASLESLVQTGLVDTVQQRSGIHEGAGAFTYLDGCRYEGEWQGGLPHGRGRFEWPSGECFEGEWRCGVQHGMGTFSGRNGSTFYGSWLGGKQHGEGVYRPVGPASNRAQVIYMQEYRYGTLLNEQVLRVDELDVRKREEKKRSKKAKHTERLYSAEVVRPGETVYKGHRSYDLMRQLQLGILFSVAKGGSLQAPECGGGGGDSLTEADFQLQVQQYFPGGSHGVSSFKWKDYSPTVFQRLRACFGLDNIDYLLSLTGDESLREMSSPGKSGSVFFLSNDDRFLIKSVSGEEMQLLLELIPKYYRHVSKNPQTLLTRFYGVHRISTPINGHTARFVVMGNVFPTDVRLQRKYDLKGSWYKRTSGLKKKLEDPNAILKDLDLDVQLLLESSCYERVMKQLAADCELLRQLRVMDYSLLLGMHVLAWGNGHWEPPECSAEEVPTQRRSRLKRIVTLGLADRDGGGGSTAQQAPTPQVKGRGQGLASRFNCFKPRVTHNKSVYRQDTLRNNRDELPQHGSFDGSSMSGQWMTPRNPSASLTAERDLHYFAHQQSLGSAASTPVAAPCNGLGPASVHSTPHASSGSPGGEPPDAAAEAGGCSAEAPTLATGMAPRPDALTPVRTVEPVRKAAGGADGGKEGVVPAGPTHQPAPPPIVAERNASVASWQQDGSGELQSAGSDVDTPFAVAPCPPALPSHPSTPIATMLPATPSSSLRPMAASLFTGFMDSFGGALGQPLVADSDAAAAARDGCACAARVPALADRLGASVPAIALSTSGKRPPQAVLLYFGVIDFLQDYNLRKRLEHAAKSTVLDGSSISVVNPNTYSRRFQAFMAKRVFTTKLPPVRGAMASPQH